MASYRIYHVGPGGRLQLALAFEGANDEDVVARSRSACDGKVSELWAHGRLVGRFSKLGVFTPASES